jgi:hypothetical protein
MEGIHEHTFLFSSIRTFTVGSGFSPDLLTLHLQALAGSPRERDYRRWGITPRPENSN